MASFVLAPVPHVLPVMLLPDEPGFNQSQPTLEYQARAHTAQGMRAFEIAFGPSLSNNLALVLVLENAVDQEPHDLNPTDASRG
eukprot:2632998-Prymnesium_polylepis.1